MFHYFLINRFYQLVIQLTFLVFVVSSALFVNILLTVLICVIILTLTSVLVSFFDSWRLSMFEAKIVDN